MKLIDSEKSGDRGKLERRELRRNCLVPPGSTCLQLGARKAKRRERRAEPSKEENEGPESREES